MPTFQSFHSHRFSARSLGRGPASSRGSSRDSSPVFPSCPIHARPAQLDRPGASPSWEELLGQR